MHLRKAKAALPHPTPVSSLHSFIMRAALLHLVLLPLLAAAQSWCPPGAEWTYYFGNQQASGTTRAWYSGDTLVGGYNAQRIDQVIHAYQPQPPFGQPFTQELDPLFTRHDDGVVHIWDQWSMNYDTLIWFGAVPGQHWNLHHQDNFTRFNVVDTGMSVVQGISLRYLVVEEPFVLFATDTIRERIGSVYFYIDPMETLMIDWTTGGLQCYHDNEIDDFHGWSWTWSSDCNFTLQVQEQQELKCMPFPNPGTTHFTLDLPPRQHTITLFDATGRMVLQQRTTDARPVINTEALPAGLYRVTVRDERGGVMGATWVKE